MADAIDLYLEVVRAEVGPGDLLLVEHRVDLSALNPPVPMFGTADCLIYQPARQRLIVGDLKTGAGVPIEAVGNQQLTYYAIGACLDPAIGPVSEIELAIIQPRCQHPSGPVRRETLDAPELVEAAADLLDAASRALAPDAPLVPGPWCRFCLANSTCEALRQHALALAQIEFSEAPLSAPPDPAELTPDEIGRLLDAASVVEIWIRALRAHAHRELEAGREIRGWKLVNKRASRRWRDPATAMARLEALGLAAEDILELRSPAQVEKLLGRGRKREIADLVVAESSGTAIAPATDARPAVASGGSEFFELLETVETV